MLLPVLITIVIVLVVSLHRDHVEQRRKLLVASFGQASENDRGELLTRAEGVQITLGQEKVGKKRCIVLRAVTPARVPSALLRQESDRDRRAKRVGLALEVQTGDPSFDDQVYIESYERRSVLRAFLKDEGLREALREPLTSRRFRQIRFEKETAFFHTDLDAADPDEPLERDIEACVAIVKQLPARELGQSREEPWFVKGLRLFPWLGSIVLFLAWALSAPMLGRLVEGGLTIALLMLLATLPVTGLLWGFARGKSDALTRLGFGFLFLFPVVLSLTGWVLLRSNEGGEQGPALSTSAAASCTRTRKRGSNSYTAMIRLEDGATFSPAISLAEYEACQRSQKVAFLLHPGALGYRWASGFRF